MNVLLFSRNDYIVELLTLSLRLRWPDLEPLVVSGGVSGLQLIQQQGPTLVMLCEALPDRSISQTITEIRRISGVPVIVVAENGSETDLVAALEMGADDYIRLPCDAMVIMARVVALMRRVGQIKKHDQEGPIDHGDLLIDPAMHEAYIGPDLLTLTPTEFKLLHLLAQHENTVLSRSFIGFAIWNDDTKSSRNIKKYIQRLRGKLGDDAANPRWIETMPGFGYRFVCSNLASQEQSPENIR